MSAVTPRDLVDLTAHARRRFEQRFGRPAKWAAAAPGRVNLIGEHTDYNGGFVLPMAIDRQTILVAAPATGENATLYSAAMDQTATFSVEDLDAPPDGKKDRCWSEYIRGVVAGCREHDLPTAGFDAVVVSNVPLGAGLSSSAALEAATATLIEAMAGRQLGRIEKALLCQRAEHRYAGVPCGIMDQFASVLAEEGNLLRIDCRSQEIEHVPFADPDVAVLIVNSNVCHSLADGEYAKRRSECAEAAKILGVPTLREATLDSIRTAEEALGPVRVRRARHIVTENHRVLSVCDALNTSDWPTVGERMVQSHASLRDDYEVSCSELDLLVDLARELGPSAGVFGARMTGGGFGGCIVCLVNRNAVEKITQSMHKYYENATGIRPSSFATQPSGGAAIVKITFD